jgi:callose synthase
VYEDVQNSITNGQFVIQFNLSALGLVLNNTTVLTEILAAEPQKKEDKERKEEEAKNLDAAEQALIGLYEVVMQDFMIDPDLRYKYANSLDLQAAKQGGRLFSELKWPTEQEKADVDRLNYILTIKDSALNVPRNLEARRRLQYFTTSLFMTMPAPPAVRKMFSFSVFTPYYDEDVMYSIDQLTTANVDGITTLFYLQKIYPDEWTNFLERQLPGVDRAQLATCTENHVKDPQQLRLWASYRGQTLARTVRGMMYYKYALELQGSQEGASTTDEEEGLPVDRPGGLVRSAKVQAELKFTYVVSCQSYGEHKNSPLYQDKVADIAYLMYKYDSLRIAYVDTVKEMKDGRIATMTYYSKLIKADPSGRNQVRGRKKKNTEIWKHTFSF